MQANTNVLDQTTVNAFCGACGGAYSVTFEQIALAHEVLNAGCMVQDERECLPLPYAALASQSDVDRARRGWVRARFVHKENFMPEKLTPAEPQPGPDTRVLDYIARAPMTYPVPLDLLPKSSVHRPCACGKSRGDVM